MIVLASKSPRRAELLHQLQVEFSTVDVNVDESHKKGESAEAFVQRLAQEKCQAGWDASEQSKPVLGADTIVVIDGNILGKPVDKQHSAQMLNMLSGNKHQVMTAVAMRNADIMHTTLVSTDVWFTTLSGDDIDQYWQSGEPQDKAGSYAIQGIGGQYVTRMEGSYSAVVGLPLFETRQLLQQMGAK